MRRLSDKMRGGTSGILYILDTAFLLALVYIGLPSSLAVPDLPFHCLRVLSGEWENIGCIE